MKIIKNNFEKLNAYVDGELSSKEAAQVAEEIAADPELGRIVAKLHALKSAVSGAFNSPTEIMLIEHESPRYAIIIGAVAATLLLAIIIGGVWFNASHTRDKSMLAEAISRHDSWVSETHDRQSLVRNSSELVIPDLTPAGLELIAFEPKVVLGNRTAARLAFIGERGCQLSLYVLRGTGELLQELRQKPSNTLVEHWSYGTDSFLLVSRKMNGIRFSVIAKALKSSTSRSIPIDERMRQALANARQPCKA